MFKQQHYVVLSLEKEQRTAFDDAKMTEMGQDMLLYLECMKYRDMQRPYNDFLLCENFMLIAHGNIISCYDVHAENFVAHQVIGDTTNQDKINPVRSIFRYQCEKDSAAKGIGVLLQDGSII